MLVLVHPSAAEELRFLPTGDREAMQRAIEKLRELGDQLPFPHSSAVKGADRLRELRPRAGRSAWRAFYRRVGDALIIAAIGPEAKANAPRFDAAVRAAEQRIAEVGRGAQ